MKKITASFLLTLLLLLLLHIDPIYAANSYLKTTIPLSEGTHPLSAAADENSHKIFVVAETPNKLYVINSFTDQIISNISLTVRPQKIAFDANHNQLYITSFFDHNVLVFDANTLTLKTTITGIQHPMAIAINENTNLAYITNTPYNPTIESGLMFIVDTVSNTIINTKQVGSQPSDIAINPDQNIIYVISQLDNPGLTVVDGLTNSSLATLYFGALAGPFPAGLGPESDRGIAFDPIQNKIFIANQFLDRVFVVDSYTNSYIGTIFAYSPFEWSLHPVGIAADPALHKAYLANSSGSWCNGVVGPIITVIDTVTNNTLQQVCAGPAKPDAVNNFNNLTIDLSLHKVYAPHYGDSYVSVIAEENLAPVSDAGPDQTAVVNNQVTLDGSGSHDLDSNQLTYSWNENMGNPQTGILIYSNAINPSFIPTVPGNYEFTLIVNDGSINSGPDTVLITVQTPSEAIEDMVDLIMTFNLQHGIENSLDVKLNTALEALNDLNNNNNQAAINSLQAFMNAVEAQRGNKIANNQADQLIAAAQIVINSLSY